VLQETLKQQQLAQKFLSGKRLCRGLEAHRTGERERRRARRERAFMAGFNRLNPHEVKQDIGHLCPH